MKLLDRKFIFFVPKHSLAKTENIRTTTYRGTCLSLHRAFFMNDRTILSTFFIFLVV